MNDKRLWLGLIIGFLGSISCQRERSNEAASRIVAQEEDLNLRLMSFNVRYENIDDRGTRSWSQRVIGAVKMIHRISPDVIGVQEAQHGQAADLWASLSDYAFYGVGRDDGKRLGEYAGIFYRQDRFQCDLTERGEFWLSDTPEVAGSRTWGNEIPRIATWMRLTDRLTGREVYIFNTHWDHKHQGSREKAALLIAQRIDARQHPEDPVVLMGDFNSVETNVGMGYLTGRKVIISEREKDWTNGLMDSFQTLHAREKNRRTLHFWGNTREGSLKVDHILVSQGAKIESAEIISGDKPMISDHFSVTAGVKFPEKKRTKK